MPNIRISGIKPKYVKQYTQNMDEICELIKADPKNVLFIASKDKVYPKTGKRNSVFITVEWMERKDKEELIAKHLTEHFKKYTDKVCVFFTDINNKWYVNGKKI